MFGWLFGKGRPGQTADSVWRSDAARLLAESVANDTPLVSEDVPAAVAETIFKGSV